MFDKASNSHLSDAAECIKISQMIRDSTLADSAAICAIYNHYILNSTITFEEEILSSSEMESRLQRSSATLPWLVYEDNGVVVGYAYASPWNDRSAYRFAAETTVYLSHSFLGQGIGTRLYQHLLAHLRSAAFHTAIGGIALPNDSSVRLHEKLGFKKVAHFQEVGWKMDRWIDVGYWQLELTSDVFTEPKESQCTS